VAFDELELKRIERAVGELCRRCSPPQHADGLRTVYEVESHSVTAHEERSPWDGVGEWTRRGIARLRFSSARREWRLYWRRQDLRWHRYDPDEMPADLDSLVAMVEADKYGAFFG
jgi:hypothetical protein